MNYITKAAGPRTTTSESPPSISQPIVVGSIIIDGAALREAIRSALIDPLVIDQLAKAISAAGVAGSAALPRFMNTREYAQHARISARTLDYLRQGMTEGIHFSRTGRRVRYHVTEADEFVSARGRETPKVDASADLKELARREVAKRRLKTIQQEGE